MAEETAGRLSAPRAKKVPTKRTFHGDTYVDNYEWLRDKDNQEVIDLLNAENAYADQQTAHLEPLREQLVEEFQDRTKLTDVSVPVRIGDWWYYQRTREGKQYAAVYRVPASSDGLRPTPGELPDSETGAADSREQLVWDGDVLADGRDFFLPSGFAPSPDGNLCALGVNFTGDERFILRIFDIATGELIDDSVTSLGYGLAWTADSKGVFYARVNDSWRTWQVWLHRLGSSEDELIFQENDEKFEVGFEASRDGKWVVIGSESSTASEVTLASTEDPAKRFVVTPRRPNFEYSVEPAGDQLLVTHNLTQKDFEVSAAPLATSKPESWTSVYAPAAGEHVNGTSAYQNFAVIRMRAEGERQLRVIKRERDGWGAPVTVHTPAGGSTYLVTNGYWESEELTYEYESLVTPTSTYGFAPATGESWLIKQVQVPNFDPSSYIQEAVWVTAQDGTQVPMTVVRRREVQANGTNPGYIYGYGSYEVSNDPYFDVQRISLLDRGVVIGWTHIRGGGELGRAWYEDGKLLNKKCTFSDFVDSARWLIDNGWVAPDRLAAEGRSAGGLLMGAVANLAPETFRAILAGVPFVDALTTILKPELPLTSGEWEEWGNPIESEEVYRYMKEYSPVENIKPVQYPAIFAATSLNDIRVFYVEPTKWIQLLRENTHNAAGREILERIEMVAGHFGTSGRLNHWKQRAYELAWLLDQIGATARI